MSETNWAETNAEVVRANFTLASRVTELREALEHVRMCRECSESDFENCEGGRAALAAMSGERCGHGTHLSKPCDACTKLVVALEEHDGLKARVAMLKRLIADAEWCARGEELGPECPWCGVPIGRKHRSDCPAFATDGSVR